MLQGTTIDSAEELEAIEACNTVTMAQHEPHDHPDSPSRAVQLCGTGAVAQSGVHGAGYADADRPELDPAAKCVQDLEGAERAEFARALELLHAGSGVDFTQYRSSTLYRRMMRRAGLLRLDSLTEYATYLDSHPEELKLLYRDVLIGVTQFFRDPKAFEALRLQAFPALFAERAPRDPIRVWVVGCATGEEAYSLAIALTEYRADTHSDADIVIYGTDLNEVAIEQARTGLFPESIANDVPPATLLRFFTPENGGYRVARCIREMCVFAQQDVLSDPPFSRMDLVSCRNLLIYLEAHLKAKVLPSLHYALKRQGWLFLGPSESTLAMQDAFETRDAGHRIYRKKHSRARASVVIPPCQPGVAQLPLVPEPASAPPPRDDATEPPDELDHDAARVLLDYAPPGVLIDSRTRIQQIHGDVSPYLGCCPAHALGQDLLQVAREEFVVPLCQVLEQTMTGHEKVLHEARFQTQEEGRAVGLTVSPASNAATGTYWVLFEPVSGDAQLQKWHTATLIVNEELKTLNEELQTSREEIHSSNEELVAVNEELQKRNAELNELNAELKNLVGSVRLAMVTVTRDLRIRRFTPRAEELLHLIHGDVGRSIADLNVPLSATDLPKLLAKVIDSALDLEQEVQDRLGRWYLLRIRPYRALTNEVDGAVLILIDIDQLKKDQAALSQQARLLEQTNQELARADRAKNEFLAMLAHELRNPLAPLRNAVRILQSAPQDQDVANRTRELIDRQVTNMVRLVDDLLDAARLTRGQIRLQREPIDLQTIISRAVEASRALIDARRHRLTVLMPPAPIMIDVDPTRMEQVFNNLLQNAAKYTDKNGSITVTVAVEESDASGTRTAVATVRDDGIGIEPELLPRVFDLFAQGSRTLARTQGGLGIGLHVVRSLVELHGGEVDVFSAGRNQGSDFTVRLPILETATSAAGAPSAHDLPIDADGEDVRSVLVVDDNPDIVESTATLLRLNGYAVQTALNGAQALAMARECRPRMLLLDIGMPGMDGYAVARQIRADPELQGMVLVAVSGYGSEADQQRSREAGFDHHVVKPFDINSLQLLTNAPQHAGTAPPPMQQQAQF